MEWAEGMPCRVVEHDDATRRPREGGCVHLATVSGVAGSCVFVLYADPGVLGGQMDPFWSDSGWRAWDGEFRWRLAPAGDAATAAGGELT